MPRGRVRARARARRGGIKTSMTRSAGAAGTISGVGMRGLVATVGGSQPKILRRGPVLLGGPNNSTTKRGANGSNGDEYKHIYVGGIIHETWRKIGRKGAKWIQISGSQSTPAAPGNQPKKI